MARYNRNINVKHYNSVGEILDSVNNDPKRPGYQIVYLDRLAGNFNTRNAWVDHLVASGYSFEDVVEKRPKIGREEYIALIVQATPEQALALKICF